MNTSRSIDTHIPHQESLFEGDHGDRTKLFDDREQELSYGEDYDGDYDERNNTDDLPKVNEDKLIENKKPTKGEYFLNGR